LFDRDRDDWSGLCPSGKHGLDYRGQICDLCPTPYTVWSKDESDAAARPFAALSVQQAAEQCARQDWAEGETSWPTTYHVRDDVAGTIWAVNVTIALEPAFVTLDTSRVEMAPTTHVMWGGHALCEDLRLRRVPRDWPQGQRWISLKDVADGAEAPPDSCAACWAKAPELVAGLLQIGKDR
jgi:hypothetical protein